MEDRIDICGDTILRIVNAKYKHFNYDVLTEDFDTGQQQCRYLYFTQLAGYTCVFPGEKLGYYYGHGIQEEEEFNDAYQHLNLTVDNSIMNSRILNRLAEARPQYKYILKKIDAMLDDRYFLMWEQLFRLLHIYDEHPECEMLMCPEFCYLALNKSLYKLKPETKSKLIRYMNKHKEEIGNHEWKLNVLLYGMRYDIAPNLVWDVQNFFCSNKKKVVKYINSTPDYEPGTYRDYIHMCKKAGHDVTDPYWEFPKSVREAHNKVSAEIKQMEMNKQLAKQTNLQKAVKRFQKFNTQIDSYKVFIPNMVDQFEKASDVLSQCLMTANYIDKVIKQDSIIIMIWDENENPIATAEIDYKKQIKQFYADEEDHFNCTPSEEVRNVLNKFLTGKTFRRYKLQTDF